MLMRASLSRDKTAFQSHDLSVQALCTSAIDPWATPSSVTAATRAPTSRPVALVPATATRSSTHLGGAHSSTVCGLLIFQLRAAEQIIINYKLCFKDSNCCYGRVHVAIPAFPIPVISIPVIPIPVISIPVLSIPVYLICVFSITSYVLLRICMRAYEDPVVIMDMMDDDDDDSFL